MRHDDALLQPIIENPDDDGPRLLYADWLDNQGRKETAEFIRLQCDLAAGWAGGAARDDMERRERAFLSGKEGRQWMVSLRPWAHSLGFRRGFAENVRVGRTAEDVGPCVWEVVRRAPVRNLEIDGTYEEDTDLSSLAPGLEQLQGFMLTDLFKLDEAGLERFLTSPQLARLQTLVLDSNNNKRQSPKEGKHDRPLSRRVGLTALAGSLQTGETGIASERRPEIVRRIRDP